MNFIPSCMKESLERIIINGRRSCWLFKTNHVPLHSQPTKLRSYFISPSDDVIADVELQSKFEKVRIFM